MRLLALKLHRCCSVMLHPQRLPVFLPLRPASALPTRPRHHDRSRRIEKLEDFKSEQEALTRVRVKGVPALLKGAKALESGSKDFWRLKARVGELVWNQLEPLLATQVKGDTLEGAKRKFLVCTAPDGLVGVFPVGGSWANPPAVDIRSKPGLQGLWLN